MRVVQVSERYSYMIESGWMNENNYLLTTPGAEDYYHWIWKIDMFTAEFELEPDAMCDGRETNFAVCNIGHHIYVIGGSGYTNGKCERLDVLSRKWSRLPGEF